MVTDDIIRTVRRRYSYVERRLVTACCGAEATLNGVADALGGVHWCRCGMAWRMRELVVKGAAA